MIEPTNPNIPIYRQCKLLELSRSSYYYEPAQESEYNLELMKLIDEQYTKAPLMDRQKTTLNNLKFCLDIGVHHISKWFLIYKIDCEKTKIEIVSNSFN